MYTGNCQDRYVKYLVVNPLTLASYQLFNVENQEGLGDKITWWASEFKLRLGYLQAI